MAKNHEADIENPNKKTPGVNDTYKKAIDHRSNQLNPNNPKYKPRKGK
ncbi:MAG TPA: hypothetical protein VIG45_00025 [Erysipelothrix sp.]